MLRISLCLLFTALFVSAVFAAPQQGSVDVQSLQYEFGKSVRVPAPTDPVDPPPRPVIIPVPCKKPVVCVPVERRCCYSAPVRCCEPVYTSCRPCYTPRCYPVVPRRAFVRPVYYPPYDCGCR